MSQDKLFVISVPFHEDTITCIETPEGVFVAIAPICNRLGMDVKAQRRRVQAQESLYGGVMMTSPSVGGEQEMLCIPINRMAFFLATIDAKRAKPEIRPTLERYQREAADVLDRHFRLRDEEHVEEIRQLRGQLGHCHSNLRAALPKWGQLLALNETGTYGMPVMAARVGLTQDRTYTEFQAIQRCGMLLPEKVADNSAPSWLERITELERRLAFAEDLNQAQARDMSVARYRAQRDGVMLAEDQPSLFGDHADV